MQLRPGAQKGGEFQPCDTYSLFVNVRNMSRWNEQLWANSSRWWVCFDSGGFEANSIAPHVAVSCTVHVKPFPPLCFPARGRALMERCFSWRNFKQQMFKWEGEHFWEEKSSFGTASTLKQTAVWWCWCVVHRGFWLLLHGSGNENSLLEALRSQLITNKRVFLAVRSLPADSGLYALFAFYKTHCCAEFLSGQSV